VRPDEFQHGIKLTPVAGPHRANCSSAFTSRSNKEMAELDLARKLLTKLRHVPNPTPAKLLAEFRRLVAAEEAKPRPKH